MEYANEQELAAFKLLVKTVLLKYHKMKFIRASIDLNISPSHLRNIINGNVKLTCKMYNRIMGQNEHEQEGANARGVQNAPGWSAVSTNC